MDYFEKLEKNPYEDLKWNIPERKQGTVNIIGGNGQSFRAEVKLAEYLSNSYPLETVNLILPDTLKGKLPVIPNFVFLPSTDSGSFTESQGLMNTFSAADYNLLLGDLSKNAVTGRAIASALKSSEKMTLITRDAVDLVAENSPERVLMNENLVFFASIAQLVKLLRAVYYPKMLLVSQSFNHMFTDNFKLESLDLSRWDVSSVKTMYDMFDDDHKLTTIGDVSHWNTVSLIDVGGWLNGSTSFVGDNGTLDLSGWNTSNLKSTNEMFRATKLETIDLSGWTFDAITNSSWEGAGSGIYHEYSTAMSTMFKDTAQLNTVYLSQLGLDSFNAAVNRGVRTTDMWSGSNISGFTVK